MGRRGPKPTPTEVLKLRGSWRAKKRNREPKPKPAASYSSPPAWLTTDAKREWRRVIKELVGLGLMSKLDRTALAVYCQQAADVGELRRRVKDEGWSAVLGNHYRQACRLLLSAAAEFGMTPSARSRVETAGETKPAQTWEPDDEAYFGPSA